MKVKPIFLPWRQIIVADEPCFTGAFYEHENMVKISTQKWPLNGVFLDIGAHQGIYSTFLQLLAGVEGFVYAFEPHPENLALLVQNVVPFEGHAPVAVMPFALGRANGTGQMGCWINHKAASGVHQLIMGDTPEYLLPVKIKCLDSIKFPRVDFIKIDVEHWEWEVFCGGLQTILLHRPKILVEIHGEETKKQITSFCDTYKFTYENWEATIPSISQVNEFLFITTDVN